MSVVDRHEERMEMFHARLADSCPTGVDPLIYEEILADDYVADPNAELTNSNGGSRL